MANTKKTGTTKRGTKSTKRTTAPKTGRAKAAKGGKSEAWRSKAAVKAWQTRRTNAMHANNPG